MKQEESRIASAILSRVSEVPLLPGDVLGFAQKKLLGFLEKHEDTIIGNLRILELLAKNFDKDARQKRDLMLERYGVAPMTYVLGITDACNLACKYCYSNSGSRKASSIPQKVIAAIIEEMRDAFGITYITISGGETFPKILSIAREHQDCLFFVYSNGTRISKSVAEEIGALGNIVPAISIVGPEEVHDSIRGAGSYRRMLAGVQHLKEAGVIWGFSFTESRANMDLVLNGEIFEICSAYDPFFLRMIPYAAEGRESSDLRLSENERREIGEIISRNQELYPYLIYDYVNDRSLSIGCMAGGSRYFYISPEMKVSPCVFMNVGESLVIDEVSGKTNLKELIIDSKSMRRARKLAGECSSCIVQEREDWRQAVTIS